MNTIVVRREKSSKLRRELQQKEAERNLKKYDKVGKKEPIYKKNKLTGEVMYYSGGV